MSDPWVFPWEKDAQKGLPMPDNLSLPDQMAYTALRNIYKSYRERQIDRSQAVQEKRLLRREWEKAKKEEAFNDRLALFHSKLLRDTEAAKTKVRKDPIPENALYLCDVLDGMSVKKL